MKITDAKVPNSNVQTQRRHNRAGTLPGGLEFGFWRLEFRAMRTL
jgi:hypothetical protein